MGCIRTILKEIYGDFVDKILFKDRDELRNTNEIIKILKPYVERISSCNSTWAPLGQNSSSTSLNIPFNQTTLF